jgi:hypothetical protein
MDVTSLILVKGVEAVGRRVFNEGDSLLDNSRGKKSPDWMTRTWDFVTNWFKKGLDYVLSNFASILNNSAMVLYQFDWARTDKMIWEDIAATNKGFAEQLGRMGASTLFRSTALGLTKKAKMKYPTLDPVVLAQLDDENQDEMKAVINGSLAAIRAGVTRNALNIAFMSGRAIMGLSPKEYKEPWSFAVKVDDFADWVRDKLPFNIGNAIAGFTEQLEDDFFDGLVLLGTAVQQQYAMSKAAINDSRGQERIIKFYPDAEDRTAYTFVTGTESEIKSAVNNFMVQNSAMENLNVGMVVQTTLDRSMKSSMGLRLITIYYRMSEDGGSTLPDGKQAPKKVLEIKNVRPSVDWDKIKLHCKNIQGGAVKVTAHLSDGHDLVGFFNTEAEGKSYLRPIIENICVGDLIRFQVLPPHENLKMRPQIGVYKPSSFTMQIRRETTDETKKQFITSDGKMYRLAAKSRISLRGDKPTGIDAWMLNPFVDDKVF